MCSYERLIPTGNQTVIVFRRKGDMLPKSVSCDQCNEQATVRSYGRIEFDWPAADDPTATPKIRSVRLTVDCPHCGLRDQDHNPLGQPADSRRAPSRAALLRRLKAVSTALRS
jgi:transcription elongation factor Elf1